MCVCVCVRQMSARAQIWRGGRLREGVGVGVGGQGCCHRHGNMLSHDVPSRSGEEVNRACPVQGGQHAAEERGADGGMEGKRELEGV